MAELKKKYSSLASIIRIIATCLIFYFHFESLHYRSVYPIDRIAISLFLLISGYFSYQPQIPPKQWLVKRFKQILIPYWPIITVVLILNRVLAYKSTTILNDILVFSGFSIFIENPVYAISWFITLILMFYLNFYFFQQIKDFYLKVIFLLASFLIFYFYSKSAFLYFCCYYFGFFVRNSGYLDRNWSVFERPTLQLFNKKLFIIQNYSYVFFLLHGAILLFVIKILNIKEAPAFWVSLLGTLAASFFYKHFSDLLIRKIVI